MFNDSSSAVVYGPGAAVSVYFEGVIVEDLADAMQFHVTSVLAVTRHESPIITRTHHSQSVRCVSDDKVFVPMPVRHYSIDDSQSDLPVSLLSSVHTVRHGPEHAITVSTNRYEAPSHCVNRFSTIG